MERFCVSHDCHRLGCDVEMVQSDVGEWVRYDDASAEIAKLRAEAALLFDHGSKAGAEITKLRSALAAARAALDGEREACDAAREIIDPSDYISRMHALGVPLDFDAGVPMDEWTPPDHEAIADGWCRAHDARRAAEAQPKEPPHA